MCFFNCQDIVQNTILENNFCFITEEAVFVKKKFEIPEWSQTSRNVSVCACVCVQLFYF